MTTEADKHLDLARQRVIEAIEELAAIVVAKCHGSDDYTKGFRFALTESMVTLISVRERIG